MLIMDWSSDVCSSVLLAVAVEFVHCGAPLALRSVLRDQVDLGIDDHAGPTHRCQPSRTSSRSTAWISGMVCKLRRLSNTLRAACGATPPNSAQSTNFWPRPSQVRSEEHTSELQSLMRISYAVFCLKKKTTSTHKYPLI